MTIRHSEKLAVISFLFLTILGIGLMCLGLVLTTF